MQARAARIRKHVEDVELGPRGVEVDRAEGLVSLPFELPLGFDTLRMIRGHRSGSPAATSEGDCPLRRRPLVDKKSPPRVRGQSNLTRAGSVRITIRLARCQVSGRAGAAPRHSIAGTPALGASGTDHGPIFLIRDDICRNCRNAAPLHAQRRDSHARGDRGVDPRFAGALGFAPHRMDVRKYLG